MSRHPKNIRIEDYTYYLPDERIAKYPLPIRDASKLLVYKNGRINENTYSRIADEIPAETLMVFNQTRVIHARLLFKKPTGGIIEIFCLEPDSSYTDIQTAMLKKHSVLWQCMIGGAGKWKHGLALELKHTNPDFTLTARIACKQQSTYTIELAWNDAALTFAEVLQYIGNVPLPPYLHRNAEIADTERYQTIFAKEEGSVAAPTAGLHFTENVLQSLRQKSIDSAFVTLHVGAGTFKPVKSETLNDHEMHAEWIDVSKQSIQRLIAHLDTDIIAVGTTSMRTLESLYWIGNKLTSKIPVDFNGIAIQQWDAYELDNTVSPADALHAIIRWMDDNKTERMVTRTQILIAPGYGIKIVKGLVTNFHQPASTLLLLIATLVGGNWKNIYDYALQHDFRFLSYGDGSLLWRE